MAAVKSHGQRLLWASLNLRNDREVVLAALEQQGPQQKETLLGLFGSGLRRSSLLDLELAGVGLRFDEQFMKEAIQARLSHMSSIKTKSPP